MRPTALSVLARYFATSEPHPGWSADYVLKETAELIQQGLLKSDGLGSYVTTERANIYMGHILETPLPVQSWTVPERNKP